MRRTEFRFPVTTLAGSSLKNVKALSHGHIIEPPFRIKYLLSCAASGFFEPFTLTERLLWQKRIRNHRLEQPPIFIIGFWRSGTTLLHNLLCQDPDAAYTTTFQTVFPNLLLTQSWWLKPVINFFLPAQRPYDNVSMDMDFPQEEDFGLMNLQPASIYKFFIFPADFDSILDEELFTGNLPAERVNNWKEAYRGMIAKAVFNTGGSRYIGKNPCHLTRTGLLKEMFPDAKFIFIHRHPYKVIESLYHFILSIFPGVQLQEVPSGFTRETVARLYTRIMEAYFRDCQQIPSSDLIEIRLDRFLGDIPGNLKGIYDKFGLGDFEIVAPYVQRYLAENPYPEHKPWPPDPETIRLVNHHARDIMQRLGYTGG